MTRALMLDPRNLVASLARSDVVIAPPSRGRHFAWVMPAIAAALPPEGQELAAVRARSLAAVTRLIANAQRDGAIRPDATFGDLSLLLIRLARPLPPGHDRAVQDTVAARHLAIVLAGLRSADEPLPGSGLELADLRRARGPEHRARPIERDGLSQPDVRG